MSAAGIALPSRAAFETCAPGADGACSIIFDINRNGLSNFADLLPSTACATDVDGVPTCLGIDPGPQPLVVNVSPSTLQFASGIRVGEFGRQVLVVDNLGENSVHIRSIDVVDAPGVGVSLFSTNGDVPPTARINGPA